MIFPYYFFLQILLILKSTSSYQWNVFETEDIDLCNNNTCGERIHTMCYPENSKPFKICGVFEPLEFAAENLLMGLNGLRNKVAGDDDYTAGNMNYLHWDEDLKEMAENYLKFCSRTEDECNYIYNSSYSIGQTIAFVEGAPRKKWMSNIVRNWFREGLTYSPADFDNLTEENANNFTQLIWADTKFVGCAGARMQNGHFFTCFFHPKGNIINEPIFTHGEPCRKCNKDRASCSRLFYGLCGIDEIRLTGSASIKANYNLTIIFMVAIIIIINLLFLY